MDIIFFGSSFNILEMVLIAIRWAFNETSALMCMMILPGSLMLTQEGETNG